ncbi:MAG: NYN domain-containing protein [Chthoniobacteraceae bacterium]
MHAPTPSASESIALLIDADNAPAAKIEFIIAELATSGVVNIRRAYGNWKSEKLKGWADVLHEYAIQPVQQFDLVKGKNATDMAMLVEAMDILYTKNVGTFCLVSSDCDFTPLVLRLRADGKQVIGFGGQKTPVPFVNSCSRFLYLDEDPKQEAVRKEKATNPKQLKSDTKLINLLRAAVAATANEEGWAKLGAVGSHISNQGSFDPRNYGFSKLSDLFNAIDLFEMDSVKNGLVTTYSVRDRKRTKTPPTSGS